MRNSILQLPEPSGVQNMEALGGLFACPDCKHRCSNFAEACPACGRFFRAYARDFKVRPGDGWSIAIFWGIMLAWIIPTLVTMLLVVAVFVIGGIGIASLSDSRPIPTPTATPNRQP